MLDHKFFYIPIVLFSVFINNTLLLGGSEMDGQQNVYYGFGAGDHLDGTGAHNTFMGVYAGGYITSGSYNVFIGHESGFASATGNYNTFIGRQAGQYDEAELNTFIGYQSGRLNTGGHHNTFNGSQSGYSNNTGFHNTFMGSGSGRFNRGGNYNTFSGAHSGYSNTEGDSNVFNGYWSGYTNTTGNGNTFSGSYSGYSNMTGVNNTFLGRSSGYSSDVSNSVYLGYQAGYWNTRDNTLYITNSKNDLPLIYGEFDNDLVRINGNLDVTKEIDSGAQVVTELFAMSLNNVDTAGFSDTGFKLTNQKEDVSWTFRTLEDDDLIPDNHNAFAISKKASGAKEFILTRNDDTGGTKLILSNGAYCDGIWHNASSRSLKNNIKVLDAKEAMKAFEKLQPVTYAYNSNPNDPHVGFIAEDVPDLVADPERRSISTVDIVAVLTKVVAETRAEAKAEMKAKDERISVMEAEIAELKTMQKKVAMMEAILTNLALETSSSDKEKVSMK